MTLEVFLVFLRLGLGCFGGPVAHIVLFRREFVERRGWIGDAQFGQLMTLSQSLPGPGSSKLGFVIGLLRAGWPGALAAFLGFTLPSALLLYGFATALPMLSGPLGAAVLHGLKLVALSVVAFGLVGMSRALCPDLVRRLIAAVAAAIVLTVGQAWVQLLVVGLGAAAGAVLCRAVRPAPAASLALRYGPSVAVALVAAFFLLLAVLALAAPARGGMFAYVDAFYRTGALAFGGGHVVLPLFQDAVVQPGWISQADFLAGYGAAQAVPGPMFALSAYLGARLPGGGAVGAALCLLATFLPGFLLIGGALPFWRSFAAHRLAARAIAGTSAVVVGLLAAALYDPLWISAVRGPADVLIAALGALVLMRWQTSALLVVGLCVGLSVFRAWMVL